MIAIIAGHQLTENHPTLVYAGRELCKYLDKMLGCPTGILVTAEHPENIPSGMLVMCFGRRTFISDLQFWKRASPRTVTLSGITIWVIPVQASNATSSMVVTP